MIASLFGRSEHYATIPLENKRKTFKNNAHEAESFSIMTMLQRTSPDKQTSFWVLEMWS